MRAALLLPLLVACSEYEVAADTDRVDQHFLVENVRTDILFYADTSYSMVRELQILGSTIDAFVGRLDQGGQDWQLIAVTGPDGCAQSGILTPETRDLRTRFEEGIFSRPEGDSVDEWGLHNAMRAVLKSTPGQCNEGFVRPGATLHVVFLTDEDDNSPGFEAGGDYWRTYVDPVLYAKESPELVRYSAVAGPVPNGCEGADPGSGYWDAVLDRRGEFVSICEDWTTDLGLLADASVVREFFELEREPVPETMLVHHNEVLRESGWVYEAEGNRVRFLEDLPSGGDEVRVTYDARPE